MDSKALQKFVKRLLFIDWFPFNLRGRRARVAGSKILKIVHVRSQLAEYHGLIQVVPAGKEEGVIRRINRAKINGQQLQAHTYNRRFSRLDRRKTMSNEQRAPTFERREIERRRKHLVSQVVDASLSSRLT
jgi:hypothetical protein